MEKPVFYQAKLVEIDDVINHVYPLSKGQITLEERLPNNGQCLDCGNRNWWLLPKESIAVNVGGKPYIECLECGYSTHL